MAETSKGKLLITPFQLNTLDVLLSFVYVIEYVIVQDVSCKDMDSSGSG
jgi:hypothetical protein